jgi:homocysteine S-methyltransferase
LLDAEPDCIAVETQPRLDEAVSIVRLLEQLDAPDAWVTFTCRDGRFTAHGEPIEDAIAAVASSPKVVAVGVNCTAPEFIDELLRRARTVTEKPLIAYPNAGRVYDAASKTWSGGGQTWDFAGAQLVGGCCGIAPTAIDAVSARLRQRRG